MIISSPISVCGFGYCGVGTSSSFLPGMRLVMPPIWGRFYENVWAEIHGEKSNFLEF
jgi:hypothetical protein